jgi:hypothetical protein
VTEHVLGQPQLLERVAADRELELVRSGDSGITAAGPTDN